MPGWPAAQLAAPSLWLPCRALCMELTRAAHSSSQMQAALLPMLGGIEARLVQVLGMRPRQAALQPAVVPS